jgi:NADPH-dependent glutamate synthase beta subunit-like oxidoreductase/NAD(P)H-flavin reductase
VQSSAGSSGPELVLGLSGFTYADLYEPAGLRRLHDSFLAYFEKRDAEAFGKFEAYRVCAGSGFGPKETSEALLAAAPHLSAFVGELFGVSQELEALERETQQESVLWRFKKEFGKKRVRKADAGAAWTARGHSGAHAACVAGAAIGAFAASSPDEEHAVATAVMAVFAIDDTARKVAKAGGVTWTDALRGDGAKLLAALATCGCDAATSIDLQPSDATYGDAAALTLDAFEAWLGARVATKGDAVAHWHSLHVPHDLNFTQLVQLRRPKPETEPELAVGPAEHLRDRPGFALTDRRGDVREVLREVDYCLYCHDRDKDSCSKGLREPKTQAIKKNPLGVALEGCPLDEKISEAHALRSEGLPLAALGVITVDNPTCPGTGHRICNDCMKACVFQKQEPVNIPQIETRVLTEVLNLPWGFEIYGLLTRWNPLRVEAPYTPESNGNRVLVVGLGPAGYTLVEHLALRGFEVVAIDALKLEPLPVALTGSPTELPKPVYRANDLFDELDERVVLGFGGVSEYGITVRWDKNFLALLYLTMARHRAVRIYGGVRFGGTMDLDDAWTLGFDHVAMAAGAGRPTIVSMKNNLARGIRKASDFLMGLQSTGAFRKDSLAVLQVSLPAIVIGGGLTAIDTATELLAYYLVQIEKEQELVTRLRMSVSEANFRALFDDEEWATLSQHLEHAAEWTAEKTLAKSEGRAPHSHALLDKWGGVSLVYRRSLEESPAYRLNHEEVTKSLEEGVRYYERLSPKEAKLDRFGAVEAMVFERADGSLFELPARTVCVAAGTAPNTTYEKEKPGSFAMDARGQYFATHKVVRSEAGALSLEACAPKDGFFTSYAHADEGGGERFVSFYGDNHPHYAGSVVRAMASAKHGSVHVARLFEGRSKVPSKPFVDFAAELDGLLVAKVHSVQRLTKTIVEVVVHAPLAARKFQPGQFYRLQSFETNATRVDGYRISTESLALTGAWVDEARGLMGTIVLEMGASSKLCAALSVGEQVVLMGPTGTPTDIEPGEDVLLAGGGLGNAVLFSIARAFKARGSRILYFAGYRDGGDIFKQDDVEAWADQVIYATDRGDEVTPRRPQDVHFRGNIVQAMTAYARGQIGGGTFSLRTVSRIIAIGSDRMMAAVKEARHGVLAPYLGTHKAIGSINSPMQCMMKEVCAQCLQRHVDPVSGKETLVFSCLNQDQDLDLVDFDHLRQRLRANSMQEKLANLMIDRILAEHPDLRHV